MNTLAKYGQFEVVRMDSARHKHRGIKEYAVRDAQQNYSAYCRTVIEADQKARELDQQNRKAGGNGKALGK